MNVVLSRLRDGGGRDDDAAAMMALVSLPEVGGVNPAATKLRGC